jgi:glutamyl-tRNA reductase
MDPNDREVLDKVVQHLEKKYMSVPMKMAREILLEESGAKSSDKQ